MFGRRRREEAAAAEAAREAERRALFAKLAERPEHICPFLGLDGDRAGYIEGVSDDHRCFAFGDPATLSAEQQTRVCQERGYGNCPRYLRGVLVIPTEELEALRQRRAPMPEPVVVPADSEGRRRRVPLVAILALLLLIGGGVAGGIAVFGDELGIGGDATPSATIVAGGGSTDPSASASASVAASAASPTVPASFGPSPTPEPTPEPDDVFAFYEVSVSPGADYRLFRPDDDREDARFRTIEFANYSFARVEATRGADGRTYWNTAEGDLEGWAYRSPDSGPFRVRAVFLTAGGERRSIYLDDSTLDEMPQATPTPAPPAP